MTELAAASARPAAFKLSIVVPCFNEEANIEPLHAALSQVAASCADDYEILLVNDGSSDETLARIKAARHHDGRVSFISFSRNFGHEAASTAGLCHASGDAVVLIDADLQDPPEMIAEMVEKWRAGYDIVAAQRKEREAEGVGKKLTASLFYRLLMRLSDVSIPRNTGDFRLMDRRVVEAFRRMPEYHRFVRGMVAWLGFKQILLPFERRARHAGETKYGFYKLLSLSFTALTGFSTLPLRLATLLGLIVMFVSLVLAGVIIVQKFFLDTLVSGYAFAMVAVLGLGSVQLLILGILGEYVGKIYRETQRRPLYLIAESEGLDIGPG